MTDEPVNLPSIEIRRDMPTSLAILANDAWYERTKQTAVLMSKDTITMPKHLHGKAEACFSIVVQSYNWNLDWMFVARCTYMTPGGQMGFYGKLVQAILEESKRFIGGPKIKYVGDWSRVTGKFTKKQNQYGKDYVVPTWTEKDAEGLGIIVSWQRRDEDAPRVWPGEDEPFYLTQCFPLNSPLWATDPRTQIRYLAMRRFADQASPGSLGGMPFDAEDMIEASERAHNITPETARPRRADFDEPPAANVVTTYEVIDHTGEATMIPGHNEAAQAFKDALDAALREGVKGVLTVWENSAGLMDELEANGHGDLTRALGTYFAEIRERAGPAEVVEDEQDEPGANEPEEENPAPQARPEPPKPAPQVRREAPQELPLNNGRAGIFNEASWTIERTTQANGKPNWPVMRDQMIGLIGQCGSQDEVKKLLGDNEPLLADFKEQAPVFFSAIAKAEQARRAQV